MESPLVGIILINWNGIYYTERCIDSLVKCNYKNLRIYVVDNDSDKSEVQQLIKNKDIELISLKQNLGFTGGNNAGIRKALREGCEYIMLLNNDTEVRPDFIEPLIQTLEGNPKIGAVQPLIYYLEDKSLIWNAGGKLDRWTMLPKVSGAESRDSKIIGYKRKIDWATGCCIMANREVWITTEGLDDKFFFLFEDVDWSLTLREKNMQIYFVPESVIYHAVSVSTTSEIRGKEGYIEPRRHYQNIRNHLFLIRKHVSRTNFLSVYVVQIIKWITYLSYFLVRRRYEKFLFTLKGIKDGILK